MHRRLLSIAVSDTQVLMPCPSYRATLVLFAPGALMIFATLASSLNRHTRMSFASSTSRTNNIFDLIHCDLWTSPVVSVSGHKYYLVIIDDRSYFVWTFSL
jgi:hypothetical protein